MTKTRILVVEDEDLMARSRENSLKQMGCTVPAIVSSGEEAIQQAAATQPDLVLMDIALKGKMDGVEAAQEIRARFDLPVVFLTAYDDEETFQRARSTEPFGYVLKPFKERELCDTMDLKLFTVFEVTG